MILLTAEKLRKSYTQRLLLDDASLGIHQGDKIGIIGVNGTGKSTLLKILAGVEQPDSGLVTTGGGVRVGYLPQNPEFDNKRTLLAEVSAQVSAGGGDSHEYECKSILGRLGLPDFDLPMGQLSGGQRKRAAMAIALVRPVDILILDEPTNHIDSETVGWLEDYLRRYRGALVMVTHDRYFLDRVVNQIVELADGKLYPYQGGYTQYLEGKAQREDSQAATQRKRQSLLKKELAWLQRGPRARGTKSRFRIQRYEEQSALATPTQEGRLEMSSMASRLGKKIIELSHLSKAYGDKVLLRDFSYLLLRDDRIGITGKNGCGKSTLFKIITGEVAPDSGTVDIGETVRLGYFSQEGMEFDPSQRVIDCIRDISNAIETPDGTLTASQMLETFLFDSTLQYTPIGRLSGGERRRLSLLCVLMAAPNVLLLDEPTNDLDIQTLTILEDYLEGFPGAVLAVSHDRYFLDKMADQIFAYREGGQVRRSNGGYTDYLDSCALEAPIPPEPSGKTGEKAVSAPPRPKAQKVKFTFQEQKDYNEIDGVIAALEAQLADNEAETLRQASDFVRLGELMAQKTQLEADLAQQMDRWVYLNDLAQEIEATGTK